MYSKYLLYSIWWGAALFTLLKFPYDDSSVRICLYALKSLQTLYYNTVFNVYATMVTYHCMTSGRGCLFQIS